MAENIQTISPLFDVTDDIEGANSNNNARHRSDSGDSIRRRNKAASNDGEHRYRTLSSSPSQQDPIPFDSVHISPMYWRNHCFLVLLAVISIFALFGAGHMRKEESEFETIEQQGYGISEGSVVMRRRNGGQEVDLPYLRCGSTHSASNSVEELVLLHGAAFTKEDWRKHDILTNLCQNSRRMLSVTALDLSVSEDGMGLADAFDSLKKEGILSGRPASFVTPSASGKAMVSLGEMAAKKESDVEAGLLRRMVKSWIPVASFAVISADPQSIRAYVDARVPILAIHGDQDSRGKDVTERLVKLASAKGVELSGRHPCYLDSPVDFVETILEFLGLKLDEA